jgi:hypothetical protein
MLSLSTKINLKTLLMLDQLQLFEVPTSQKSTLSPLEALAKTLALLESVEAWKENEAALSWKQLGLSKSADLEYLSGKMLKELSAATLAKTLRQSSKSLPTLGAIDSSGNCLIHRGFYPKIESGYTLSDILQSPEEIGEEYFLSEKQEERIMNHPRKKVTNL